MTGRISDDDAGKVNNANVDDDVIIHVSVSHCCFYLIVLLQRHTTTTTALQ